MNQENQEHQTVDIFIGKHEHKSPNPTTGHALYELGKVSTEFNLWREIRAKDDELITDNATVIHLKNGDHFHTIKKELNPGFTG